MTSQSGSGVDRDSTARTWPNLSRCINSHCTRPFSLNTVSLLGVILLVFMVTGCDHTMSALDEEDSRSSGPVLADSLDLSLNPMPTGATLLAPGEPAPKDNARASAYGCYLASRPYSDEVAFHSKYLHFPESVVEEAGTDTRQVAWSREARLEANASTDAVGVRYMNCVIPDTDEAEQLAREQILEAGFEDATYEAVQDNEASSKTTCEMITVVEVTCAGPSDGPLETCTFEENTYLFCHGGDGPGSGPGDFPDPGDGPGGGDPGDGDPGEGNECTIDNPDPGSDCEPLDPCDGSNPPEACDEDEEPCVPSLSDLESIFENAETEIVEDVHEAIEENISEFDIGGELEVAHFLGQVYHETGGLTTLEEGMYYTSAERLKEICRGRFSETDPELPDPNDYLEDPEKLANYVYADRIGNGDEESGDGWKYRGRGLLQLTGKANYQAFTDFYQEEFDSSSDFVNTPGELASDTELATKSGMWFYDENVLSHIDEVTIEDVTEAINPVRVGEDERGSQTEEAQQVIDCE